MPAEFEVINDDIIIRMEWTNTQEVAERVVSNAAAYLFSKGQGDHGEDGERLFSDLGNQEQLDLVYNHFGTVAKNAADTWVSTEAQRIAREATIPHEL